ncbi:MAG: Mur ligase family protein [Microgenomates group bacterium]
MSKNLPRILNNIFPFLDFLYILQLEEYENIRYFKRLKNFFWRRNLQKRDKLIFTKRIKIIFLLSTPFGILMPPLIPIIIGISNFITTPYFEFIRLKIQKRASIYFRHQNKKTKVIAVAGSYGKTTTKNYIYELVKYNYKTQMIPGNINTPTGIANWILTKFDPSSELLIVEVDSYFIGEIGRSLRITPPDIAILTNVGDQHLERLGSIANLRIALNEVFDCAKDDALKIENLKSNLEYALKVANILNIPKDIIKSSIKNLQSPDRRRNLIKINGFDVIDDSYNISETTSKFGINYAVALSKKVNKKLIVITAGIPELGSENKDANINLGKMLENKAQKIILLQSILSKDVEKGVTNKSLIIKANSMKEALEEIKKFDPKKYLVLMQPELNDLYY